MYLCEDSKEVSNASSRESTVSICLKEQNTMNSIAKMGWKRWGIQFSWIHFTNQKKKKNRFEVRPPKTYAVNVHLKRAELEFLIQWRVKRIPFWEARVVHWWEHSPLTKGILLDSAIYVNRVVCWFSTVLQSFPGLSWQYFSPLHKNQLLNSNWNSRQ